MLKLGANGDLYLQTAPSGSNPISAWTTEIYRDGGTGNLGIGTTSPGAKLEVNGTGTVPLFLRVNQGVDALRVVRASDGVTKFNVLPQATATYLNAQGAGNSLILGTGASDGDVIIEV